MSNTDICLCPQRVGNPLVTSAGNTEQRECNSVGRTVHESHVRCTLI